jgi:hypothetical protein
VERKVEHPHLRFVGRAVRKKFEVKIAGRTTIWTSFSGTLKSYSEDCALFKISFEDGDKGHPEF